MITVRLRRSYGEHDDHLFTAAITHAEIHYGINLLPKGSRRQQGGAEAEQTCRLARLRGIRVMSLSAEQEQGVLVGYPLRLIDALARPA